MAKVAVLLATGFEEIEALTPIDLLRRAGNQVVSLEVDTGETSLVGARGIAVIPDNKLTAVLDEEWDCVVVPGGMPGSSHVAKSKIAIDFIYNMFDSGKLCAAICAAPAYVFSKANILDGKRYTCYPGSEEVSLHSGGIFCENRVVIDENLITSRGPGTAIEFSLAIIEALNGADVATKISKDILFDKL